MSEEISDFEKTMKAHRDIDPATGRFVKGMSGGRYGKRGKLSRINQDFIDYVEFMGEKGYYPHEILGIMASDTKLKKDLRFKAAKALNDTVFKDIEIVTMKEKEAATREDLLNHVFSVLGADADKVKEATDSNDETQQREAPEADL